jgi:DNA-binding Xre family transcriptional regulator
VHASSVSRLEQGAEVTRPSVIGKIAGALDCRVADIAEVVEDDVPEKAAV